MTAETPHITVSMYDVGFGDCFLIRIPSAGRELKILIDCGSIHASSLSMTDIVGNLIDDVSDGTSNPRIDVVIATHRHADHIIGFADPRWKDVEVAEVWLPWTECPTDAQAKQIRDAQRRLATALASALNRAAARNEALELMAANAKGNASAMNTLLHGFKGNPTRRFLESSGAALGTLQSNALPGVVTTILGPSRSEAIIRDMNPPAGKTYLTHLADHSAAAAPFEPFGDEWRIDQATYGWHDLLVPESDKAKLREAADIAEVGIAVALDKAINGTSLVLVFEVGECVLFFPGDAQWGTWKEILGSDEAKELIGRAKLLKIGHHGSHNATPREFVESFLSKQCCGLLSTKSGRWPSVPRLPLLDALSNRISLVRSDDHVAPLEAPFVRMSNSLIEARLPL